MALTQHGKLITLVPVAVVLMLLCAGSVQATLTCPSGQKDCRGSCVNPHTDVNNCGNCGVKCTAPANSVSKCIAGMCDYACKPGFRNCDGKWENGCECEPSNDVNNCGACGTKCTAPANAIAKCIMGNCDYTCKPGYKNCDGKWENGCEIAVDNDKKNCGDCKVKCNEVPNAFAVCQAKKCVYTCKRGYLNCDPDWRNGCRCFPETDPDNCGRCGNKCPTPQYFGGEGRCTKGKCQSGCKKGLKYNNGKKRCAKDGDDDEGKHGGDDGKKGKKGGDRDD